MSPAVFLDRDGVLNRSVVRDGIPVSPRTLDDFHLIESAIVAVRTLHDAGFLCIVVTNQPDLGRGLLTVSDLQSMHDLLESAAPVDAIYVCGHGGNDTCDCRKPKPGMIDEARRHHNIDISQSWLVGDRWVDIAAANAAGVRSILIEHQFSMSPTSSGTPPGSLVVDARAPDLAAAAAMIVESL